jgi:EAL domain-containing protein (putative c-di-GMP-specific phosphodiesterase class I)
MLRTLRTLFEPETAKPAAPGGKLTLREVLRRDLAELWYQPKIDLRTKRLAGAEGLIRARRPDGSIAGPGEFLPGAKEAEMLALTERVIFTALRDFDDFAVQGASVKLSVNVPVSALIKLPIARMLREHRPPTPAWPGLILEVTEDEILQDLKLANAVAEELRSLNCTLSLDDFGAGYSSLARLRELPFSELKIDRSFVTKCHADKVHAGVCETIVALARRFELATVAEGIETSAESEMLRTIGCETGQGYLFAKPMPKDAFVAALSRRLVGPPKRPAKPRAATVTTLTRGALADT